MTVEKVDYCGGFDGLFSKITWICLWEGSHVAQGHPREWARTSRPTLSFPRRRDESVKFLRLDHGLPAPHPCCVAALPKPAKFHLMAT